jgi:hypothetical protein
MTSFSGTTPTDAVELQKLIASDAATNDRFGISVALSANGNTAIVGARYENTSPNFGQGAAYVFTRSAGTWVEEQKLLALDRDNYDYFGYSVSISGDGSIVIVGALESTSTVTRQGSAYVFTRIAGVWTQQQELVASDAEATDFFGVSVAISRDGLTAVIGASNDGSVPVAQPGPGSAYIFTRSATSTAWSQQAKLTASDAALGDLLGRSVSISDDGNTVLIGADNEDTSPNSNNGAAYVFTRSGTTWTQQAKLLASDPAGDDGFGNSVDISGDGNTAVVGADGEDTSPNSENGASYIFTRAGSTWTQQAKLLASDAASSDTFGGSVSISSDGNTVLIGANNKSTTPTTSNGAAYVFTRLGPTWTQQQKILASDNALNDDFGYSVSLSADGSTGIISAIFQNTSPNSDNGAAYIYALGRTLDNKLYSYDETLGSWYVSAFGELLAPATRIFTSSNTFVVPTGAKVVEVTCIGGGGGGGGGARNVSGDGGGGGGGGGGLSKYLFRAEDLGGVDASITVTIGTGGAGGAATASGTTALDGNSGTAGGATSFGSYLQATGGSGGERGDAFVGDGGPGGRGMFYGNQGGNASSNGAFTVAGAGGGGGGGVTFGVGSRPTAFNIGNPSNSGTAGFSNATLKGPGTGGNGRTSAPGSVLLAGAGGLYGGGGGGGGEGSTGGATGAGGAGGAGANGACFVRVWYG